VLDHILGLRKDQLAREPKGKTLPGWASWCSGARTVFALVLSLTASYVIGRLFGVSHDLDTLKQRRLTRGQSAAARS